MKIKDLIEKLQRMNPEDLIVAPLWVTDDVIGMAENKDITLTDEQVEQIMSDLERRHDAEVGINWDVIDGTIDWVINNE